MKTVNILGTQYTITKKKYNDDEAFKRRNIIGYCDDVMKEIVYCKMKTWEGYEHESKSYCKQVEKETLRHEIVHAFLSESGMNSSSNASTGSWAMNEEMIEWIAQQFPKIQKVYECLNLI